jgi:streptomycin 6-kinase
MPASGPSVKRVDVPDDGPSAEAMRGMASRAVEVAADWGLELGVPYALSRYSFVAPAGPDAVLKITWELDDECLHEGEALEVWAGDGAVRLLRRDVPRRALLMERADPGTDISDVPDDEATAIAVALGPLLWRAAGPPFRWIGDHVPCWLDNAEAEGAALVPLARELYATLHPGRATLVHGDFHHHNILRHGDRYVSIDTKAMLGEPEFDVPTFLWNPIEAAMTPERTERRIAAFARAGLDEARIRAWTVIRGAYLGMAGDAETAEAIRHLVR